MSAATVPAIRCSIRQVSPLNHDVYRVCLGLPAGELPRFRAGQYLELLSSNGDASAFSIASSPQELKRTRQIELHLRVTGDNRTAQDLLEQLQLEDHIDLRMPLGTCFLETTPDRPLILVAGSTGFAQARSIIRDLLDRDHGGEVHLYWGGREPGDLYSAEPADWTLTHRLFTYHPVISDVRTENRSGLVHESVLDDFEDLSDKLIIASGSPAMVYAALDAFEQRGASTVNVLSDVFAYAPRNTGDSQ